MVSIELLKRWQKFGFAKSTTGSAELRRLIQEELTNWILSLTLTKRFVFFGKSIEAGSHKANERFSEGILNVGFDSEASKTVVSIVHFGVVV